MKEKRKVTARAFSAYGRPLEMVNSFKFLGRVISATDDDWPEVVINLACEKTVCRRMSGILSREGGSATVVWMLFKCRDTGGTSLLRKDLGGHPSHGHSPGGV